MTNLAPGTYDFAVESSIARRPPSLVELPLTPLQKRWWFLCTGYPGGSSPLVGLVHRLRGPLVVQEWVRAVGALVDRHEILRSLFVDRPGGPVQVISPPSGLDVEYIDLRDLPEAVREDRARELLNARRAVALDLEQGPLVNSSLLRLADEDYVWTMTIHHLLADGASLAVIDRELSAIYPAFVNGTEPLLPDMPVQYTDFAVWQSESDSEQEEEDRLYWREQLVGVPPLELTDALPRPAAKGAPAAEVGGLLDGELVRRVEELGRAARCSRFMVLLAALQFVLARASGQDDFCVGIAVVGAGRTRPELANLVGLFNNALALRCDLSGDPTFRELLAATRDTVLDAVDHQDLPFGEVVAELNAPHEPGRAQVFQVMFQHDEVEVASRLELPGLRVEEFALAIPKILHDLMVFALPSPDGVATRFVYDTSLFTQATMTQVARAYESLLRAAVDNPDTRLSKLM